MKKSVRIDITIPAFMKEFLEKESQETGLSQASIIKHALSEYIKKEKK